MLTKSTIRHKILLIILLSTGSLFLNSCELVGDIFEAGVWTGVIIIVLVVAILIYIFSKLRKRD